jgi:hypothetical protein
VTPEVRQLDVLALAKSWPAINSNEENHAKIFDRNGTWHVRLFIGDFPHFGG